MKNLEFGTDTDESDVFLLLKRFLQPFHSLSLIACSRVSACDGDAPDRSMLISLEYARQIPLPESLRSANSKYFQNFSRLCGGFIRRCAIEYLALLILFDGLIKLSRSHQILSKEEVGEGERRI